MEEDQMRAICTLLVVLIAGCGLSATSASQPRPEPSAEPSIDFVKRLSSSETTQRRAAYEEGKRHRALLIEMLIEIARKEKSLNTVSSGRELAVRLLGEYRASEAVETLIDDIDYAPGMVRAISALGSFPAAEALAWIGPPAVEVILAREDAGASPLRLMLYARVIEAVNNDWQIGRMKIEDALQTATGKRKSSLEALLVEYRKLRLASSPTQTSPPIGELKAAVREQSTHVNTLLQIV